ncbi:MAG: DUF6371 domain-containing protein [Tannerellaceae bacterium]|jgi:hypothetical protein|nr:DUF6371 domain-containing protein [Tannerellaceae bacterium]
MEYHKYSLAKKGKGICPECGRKTFVLYIDNSTGDPLHTAVGKCDRADNCGHHYTPKQYLTDNNISFDRIMPVTGIKPNAKPQPGTSYIDTDILKKSLQGYDSNRLIHYLCGVMGVEAAKEAIQRYFIGTSKHWEGATVFWQIDGLGRVHAGKIMQYDKQTGKRVKEPINKITWVHTVLKLPGFHLSQCFFGEHLLKGNNKPVAIVESEKTAIIASVYLPDMIWLACGGCGNLSGRLYEALRGRDVALFPDAGRGNEWSEKARALGSVCNVSVSSLIEQQATETERKAGFDLADYLVRFPPSDFIKQKQPKTTERLKTTQIKEKPGQEKQHPAYVSDTGILYIPTPPDGRVTYTVYPSVEAYNKRSELPTFIPIQSVDISEMEQVFINLNTLTI